MDRLKWLLLDTEWPKAIFYGFPSNRPQVLRARDIKNPQFCSNASWKWLDDKKVYNTSILENYRQFKKDLKAGKGFNDRECAIALHLVMSQADIISAHFADFDLKMINGMFLLHGLDPIPEYKVICTYRVAKKYFRFAGNGLDDLLKLFKFEGKLEKPDFNKMADGDEQEIRDSVVYCDGDVLGLEKVLNKMKPFMLKELPKPRLKTEEKHYGIKQCDCCQSTMLRNKGFGGGATSPYMRVVCMECGHPMKGSIKMWKKRNVTQRR